MATSTLRVAFANHHVIATYGENFVTPIAMCAERFRYGRRGTCGPDSVATSEAPFFIRLELPSKRNDVEYQGKVYYWSKHHEWMIS